MSKSLPVCAVALMLTGAGEATAQVQLPGIVVEAPSPVTPKTAPRAEQVRSAPPAQKSLTPSAAPKASTVVAKSAPTPPPAAVIDPAEGAAPPSQLLIAERSFASTAIVNSDALARSAGTSQIGDALSNLPGMTASGFAPGASRPIIRGLDNYRVRIQENGIAMHDVSDLSEDHGVPLGPIAAERIEIVRGPATLRYGSQALGGVVSVDNNRIPNALPPGRDFAATINGGFDSVSSGKEGAISIDQRAGAVVVHGDYFKRSAGDYATPLGRQANSFVNQDGGALGASVFGLDGFFGMAISRTASTYGIPGVAASARGVSIDMEQVRINGKGEVRIRDHGLEAIRWWFGYSDYRHDELNRETGIVETGSTFKKKQFEARVEAQHAAVATSLGELRGAVGFQGSTRHLSASGEGGELLAPNRTETGAAYLFEELQTTKRLRLQVAARLEGSGIRGAQADFPADFLPVPGGSEPEATARRKWFLAKSVSAGLLYEIPQLGTARVTGQYVERAPDAAELFSKGAHEATATFEIGNPNLKLEKATTFEVGLARGQGPVRYDAALFMSQFDGFIYKRFTGAKCGDAFDTCGSATELDQIVYDQRGATFRGIEFNGEYDVAALWRGVWGISGQFDLVRATFDGGGNVPRIAPMRIGAGLFYRDTNWRSRLTLLHAFAQNDIATNETPTAAYNLLNADVSYTFKFGSSLRTAPEMTIGVAAQNLLDAQIRNHVSYKKDEVLQPGRNIRVFGTLKF